MVRPMERVPRLYRKQTSQCMIGLPTKLNKTANVAVPIGRTTVVVANSFYAQTKDSMYLRSGSEDIPITGWSCPFGLHVRSSTTDPSEGLTQGFLEGFSPRHGGIHAINSFRSLKRATSHDNFPPGVIHQHKTMSCPCTKPAQAKVQCQRKRNLQIKSRIFQY